MAYSKNVPQSANQIGNDLTQMQENFSRLGDLIVNRTAFPTNPDDGQLALVNQRLHIYDATNGIWNGLNFFGFKNRVINGDFQIWQRGTSSTGITASGYYTADRWIQELNTGAIDVSQSTMNGWNSLKVTVNTVPDFSVSPRWYIPFSYRFEGQHLYDINKKGGNITISFLFRSNVTGTFCVAVRNFTDSSVQIESYVHEFQYNTAGSVQKIIFTVPFARNFNPALRNDSNLGITIDICNVSGSTYQTSTTDTWITANNMTTPNAVNWASSVGNYVEIAQVQVEEGDTATDFEVVPFDLQLLRCMRYFEKSYNYGDYAGYLTWYGLWGMWLPVSGSGVLIPPPVPFKVLKRVTPTITVYSGASGSAGYVRVGNIDRPATIDYVSEKEFRAYWSDSTTTKADTYFQWIANAEL